MASSAFTTSAVHRHLSRDPVMRRLIRLHGPCALVPRSISALRPAGPQPRDGLQRAPLRWSPYEALTRAIAHQQLHGRAAESILTRFVALIGNGRFPSPLDVSTARAARLRRAGFSRGKVRAIKDVARHALAGNVPTRRAAALLEDDAIVAQLTQIHGVGRWTVEMLLIFTLGRLDVLPVDDFGVREGYRIAYGLRERPTPRALRTLGERWKPYRSVAAWYLWRAASAARKTVKS